MKSFKEELDEIFDRFIRKMEEVLDRKEQSNEKFIDTTFNQINQQSKLEASQDEDLDVKTQSNFQSLQEKHGKEHGNSQGNSSPLLKYLAHDLDVSKKNKYNLPYL